LEGQRDLSRDFFPGGNNFCGKILF